MPWHVSPVLLDNSMPRYFFHLELEDRVLLDHEGWELQTSPLLDPEPFRWLAECARRGLPVCTSH